jgi:pimeloyl-ACP methyl ester carboxylesterase
VLIHGSSTPSRDDFRFYADLLARRGIAALIYDKRSTGGQLGGTSEVDLRDLAGDAAAAVALLKQRGDINAGRIGLWGHSQGGWVAPIAAAQSDSVAFVVGFSAPGVTYADLDKYANATRLRANGVPQADIDQAMAALAEVDDFVRRGGNAAALQERLDQLHRTRWASLTTLPRLAPTREHIRTWIRWRNLDLDPVEYWRRIRVPVLLLYGERDDVVPVPASASRIEEALRAAGNPNVTVRIFAGENHTIAGSQEFLDLMVSWIATQAMAAPGN